MKTENNAQLTPNEQTRINTVLQMLKEHPKYHKNIKDAAESQQSIILNYHIHPGESKYCVSILSKSVKHLDMEDEKSTSEELAHIKGISDLEELFVPLMSYFGEKLKSIYHLTRLPDLYLNGMQYFQDNTHKR